MAESIVDTSRDFFHEVVKPILERECPEATSQTVFGIFGYGSEAFRMDDNWSQDHHWGLRINGLMHDELYRAYHTAMTQAVNANFPPSYRGYSLREGFTGHGLDIDSLEDFLRRTIGLDHVPTTAAEWLSVPEEDIFHVINGEVWHDPAGSFSAIRDTLSQVLSRAGAAAPHSPLVPLLFRDGRVRAQARDASRQCFLRHDRLCTRDSTRRAARLSPRSPVFSVRQMAFGLL